MKDRKKDKVAKEKLQKALDELKTKKTKEKPKNNIALKDIKFEKKENILNKDNKDITIIKNRNASVRPRKRVKKRDDSNEKVIEKKNSDRSLKKPSKNQDYMKKAKDDKNDNAINNLKIIQNKKDDDDNNKNENKKSKEDSSKKTIEVSANQTDKESRRKTIDLSDVKTPVTNNKKSSHKDNEQQQVSHIYTKTDANIDTVFKKKVILKKNILKGEAKQTKNIKFDDYNTTNPVNLNKNRIVKKNRSNKILSSTFIDKKRKDNNDLEKKLNKTVVERKKKDNKDLGKIEENNKKILGII